MERSWTAAVCALDGTEEIANAAAAELAARYAQPHRRYHNSAHVEAVLRDSAALAGELALSPVDRSLLTLAVCAHDVVYDARPGDDERQSARWAREWLARAGVAEQHVARVEELVLAILGTDRDSYDRYRRAVRGEYAEVDDDAWRTGRSRVLTSLLDRDRLFGTAPGHERWEAAAKTNLRWELGAVTGER